MLGFFKRVRVVFKKKTRHDFEACMKKHGIKDSPKKICEELSYYIEQHEKAGIEFDTECQQIDFGEGLVLILCKVKGKWKIVEFNICAVFAYTAVWVWKRVTRGAKTMLRKVVAAWRMLPRRAIRFNPAMA